MERTHYECLDDALLTNESIQSIEFGGCELQKDGHRILAGSLAESKAPLRRIVFSFCGGMDKAVTAISAAMLRRADMQVAKGMHISRGECPVLAAASQSKSLRKAELLMPSKPPHTTTAFVVSLASNTSLAELDMGCNDSKSAASLNESLQKNTTLRVLTLRGSAPDIAVAVAKALSHNVTLQELGVWGPDYSAADVEAMGKALATNSSLRKLAVTGGRNTDMQPLARGIYDGSMNGTLRLEALKIGTLNMTDEFATSLGEALASPRGCSLKKLELQ